MAERKSAEQVLAEHVKVLGPQLGPLYNALYSEVVWLHAKWKQYRILYGDSPERIELLNSVAGFFFRVIQDVLWEDIVLHLARLTDPPQSMGRDNLTLLRLPGAIQEPPLSGELATLIDEVRRESAFARTWRNRHLAHRDLISTVDKGAAPLPGISRAGMERTLIAVRRVLNKIEGHYWRSEIVFEHFLAYDDAESLVAYLKLAVNAETRQRERLLKGRSLPEDIET
jgi:hypothetical protein